MPVDPVSAEQVIEPGVVRRAQKAVAQSELKLIESATSAAPGPSGPPPQPVQAQPREGGLVHIVA